MARSAQPAQSCPCAVSHPPGKPPPCAPSCSAPLILRENITRQRIPPLLTSTRPGWQSCGVFIGRRGLSRSSGVHGTESSCLLLGEPGSRKEERDSALAISGLRAGSCQNQTVGKGTYCLAHLSPLAVLAVSIQRASQCNELERQPALSFPVPFPSSCIPREPNLPVEHERRMTKNGVRRCRWPRMQQHLSTSPSVPHKNHRNPTSWNGGIPIHATLDRKCMQTHKRRITLLPPSLP